MCPLWTLKLEASGFVTLCCEPREVKPAELPAAPGTQPGSRHREGGGLGPALRSPGLGVVSRRKRGPGTTHAVEAAVQGRWDPPARDAGVGMR